MQLPLEALAALDENSNLARDQLVAVRTLEPAEVAIHDEAAACQTEEAQERPVPLNRDTSRQRVGNAVANLRVVGGQQFRHFEQEQTLDPQPLANRLRRQGTFANTGAGHVRGARPA